VWPALREAGFDAFTGRTAWRHVDTAVDVVNFQSFSASLADSVGCTPFSFSVNLGVWVVDDTEARVLKPDKKGRPRPAEWECTSGRGSRSPSSNRGSSRLRLQLVAVATRTAHTSRRVEACLRSDHDREDTWYVFSDGSNVVDMIADALRPFAKRGSLGSRWPRRCHGDYEQRVREGLV
jgi:hypothetical protein